MRRLHVVLLSLVIALAGLGPGLAQAADYGPGSVVRDIPVRGTPHVLDGRVNSVVQVGNTIILGGQFTQTRNDSSTTVIARSNLVAFDATTMQISTTFLPNPNGVVNAVLPAGDGATVYVGGTFTSIGGVARKNLARVRVSDGAVVTAFNAGSVAGQVKDLRLAGGRLWVAGGFTHIANTAQKALATVNPTTGAFNTFMRATVAGVHNKGVTTVAKIDVTADGSRLLAIGNFDTVNAVKNHQIFQLDLTGAAAALSTFRTNFYETRCSTSFDSYMRDLDYSPDGSFFVVSTTGAYGGAGTACDSTARFETNEGAGSRPSWINNTGGDTTYAVEITDSVVYTGGHARWQNNPFAADNPGQGAVPRPGIAALDPINGLPLSWNPTRDRGVGVFDFLVTNAGLWVASDTTRIGADYLRSRIALLPVGGTEWKGVRTPALPNSLYAVGSGGIQSRGYSGTAMGQAQTVPTGGLATDSVRGSFMLNGWLYIAWSDGSFDRRTFDGTTYGAPVPVDTASELTSLSDWSTDIKSMTGLFYDSGRLYFTRSGTSTLYYRYFNPESDVVGAQRLTASANVTGIDLSSVRGMFTAGGNLYWAESSGVLKRLGWAQGSQSGRPVAGTAATVSGPAVDGNNWSSLRSLFLYQDSTGEGTPNPPVAAFTSSCQSLTCTFDPSGSSVAGGTITGWSWSFGGGATSTETQPTHAFGATGTYPVTLTVTTSKGLTASVTNQVQVTQTQASVGYVDAASTNSNGRASHTVRIPATVKPGDTMLLFLTVNSSTTVLGSAPAGWTEVRAGSVSGLQGRVWSRTATGTDAGSTVAVTSSTAVKSAMTVAAYRPSIGTVSVGASAQAYTGAPATSLTTPAVPVSQAGSWLVSYWGAKASAPVAFTTPQGQPVRSDSIAASNSNNISSRLTDSGAPTTVGTSGGLVAGTGASVSRGAMFSVVLTPTGP